MLLSQHFLNYIHIILNSVPFLLKFISFTEKKNAYSNGWIIWISGPITSLGRLSRAIVSWIFDRR